MRIKMTFTHMLQHQHMKKQMPHYALSLRCNPLQIFQFSFNPKI